MEISFAADQEEILFVICPQHAQETEELDLDPRGWHVMIFKVSGELIEYDLQEVALRNIYRGSIYNKGYETCFRIFTNDGTRSFHIALLF